MIKISVGKKQMSLGKNCHSNEIYIGIDPANNGSAVVLINGTAAISVLWNKRVRKKKRVWKVSIVRMIKRTEQLIIVDRPSKIGSVIAHLPELEKTPFKLACEDIYIRAGSGRTALHLARFTGALLGGIELYHDVDVRFVPVMTWRKDVLGVNRRIKREEAKRLSLEIMPKLLPHLGIALYQQGRQDHISDAAGVALWSKREETDEQQPYKPEPELLSGELNEAS